MTFFSGKETPGRSVFKVSSDRYEIESEKVSQGIKVTVPKRGTGLR